MKKLIALLFVGMAWTGLAMAQDGPQITFSEEMKDFGEVERGDKVSLSFAFENTGKADLEIIEVKPSCGCTSADLEKKVYKPGEKGSIPITFDSARFDGMVTKTVTVKTNDEKNPTKSIRLKGRIIQEISISPNYLTLVNIKRGEMVERSIEVSTERMAKLEVTDVKSNLDFIELETVRKDDKNVSIMVKFPASKVPTKSPAHNGTITFKTNGKSTPDASVTVYIKVANPLQTTPRAVYMFASAKGKERTQVIKVNSTENKPFKITEVNADLDILRIDREGENELKVTLSEKAETGKFSGQIKVRTNLEEQPEIVIPVRGNVI